MIFLWPGWSFVWLHCLIMEHYNLGIPVLCDILAHMTIFLHIIFVYFICGSRIMWELTLWGLTLGGASFLFVYHSFFGYFVLPVVWRHRAWVAWTKFAGGYISDAAAGASSCCCFFCLRFCSASACWQSGLLDVLASAAVFDCEALLQQGPCAPSCRWRCWTFLLAKLSFYWLFWLNSIHFGYIYIPVFYVVLYFHLVKF